MVFVCCSRKKTKIIIEKGISTMKNYKLYIMNTTSNIVTIKTVQADDIKKAKTSIDIADDEILLRVESVTEKVKKDRAQHACRVTYVYLERPADNKPFELVRNTVVVKGTDGTGKSRNSNIRYMSKKCGHEIPSGAIIETVEPYTVDNVDDNTDTEKQ